MATLYSPKIVTDGLVLALDAANVKSFRGEPTVNLLPNPTINAYPTTGNAWGTYNTNQYGNGNFFSIGTVSSVSSNIVTMTSTHSLRSYDVMRPQSTGGGVTANVDYLIKKISSTQFSLHEYNNSQDGTQGHINTATGNHKVYDAFANDVRISINSTNFPTMWWGYPHLPNSGLVKELRTNGFIHPDTYTITDSIKLHYIRTDGVKDGMSYGVDATVTAAQSVTVSFYTKSSDSRAVGKVIQYYIYNYGASATAFSWNFTLGPVDVWQRQVFTYTPAYGTMISYWFPQSAGVYSWEWSNMQVEQKSYATAFVAGTRGATVATGGGWEDRSGNSNHGELLNGPTFSSGSLRSISFDGVDDFVRIENNTALDNQTPTVEVWVKTNATNQNGFWFEKGTVNSQYSLFQEGTGIQWRMNIGGVTNLTTTTATYINTSNWYQVVGTYTSGTRRLYINGVQVNSDTQSGTIATNSGGMSIGVYGGFSGGRGYYYNGNLSMCRIYNRALTATEVLQNFNATKGRYGL
jgi:hypothetical protein